MQAMGCDIVESEEMSMASSFVKTVAGVTSSAGGLVLAEMPREAGSQYFGPQSPAEPSPC